MPVPVEYVMYKKERGHVRVLRNQHDAKAIPPELLKPSHITIFLKSYSSIFSDFDPRPYTHCSLSTDFLDEIKRASMDKNGGRIHLYFLTPKAQRSHITEQVIKKRLKKHFNRHTLLLNQEKRRILTRGSIFIIVGIIFMFIATFLLFKYEHASLLITFLVVLLEPAGWFSFWEGLGIIFFEAPHITPELTFYKKMADATVAFVSQ